LGKVRDALPALMSPMPPPVGALPVNVTLCRAANDHVTDPPALIVTQFGENVFDVVALTAALPEAPPAVTVTVTAGLDVTVPDLAVISDEPRATPVAVVEVPELLESETA
jgi:hypothetical protein